MKVVEIEARAIDNRRRAQIGVRRRETLREFAESLEPGERQKLDDLRANLIDGAKSRGARGFNSGSADELIMALVENMDSVRRNCETEN